MTATDSLEPLAEYLEPQFGNVYDGDFVFERQEWTEELREAVRYYLVDLTEDELYRCGVERLASMGYSVPDEVDRALQVEAMIPAAQPWEIAYALNQAAVILRPTLDSLIAHIDSWDMHEDERTDAMLWLEIHATDAQVREMIRLAGFQLPDWRGEYKDSLILDLTWAVTPGRLLELWHSVNRAPGDLTDAEWQLVAPLIPRGPMWSVRTVEKWGRPAINGFLYRYAAKVRWSQVPDKYYGKTYQSLRQRQYVWRKEGVFARMLDALDGNPEAARLMAWLRTIVDQREQSR